MRKIVTMLALTAALSTPSAFAAEAFPRGQWTSADAAVSINIVPCSSTSADFCGYVLSDTREEQSNPVGHQIVNSLRKTKGAWRGQVRDGDMTVSIRMRPLTNGNAEVRMCFGIFCENETWTRAGDSVVSSVAVPMR
jgi:uncharacterized protein (DUF2147 family)